MMTDTQLFPDELVLMGTPDGVSSDEFREGFNVERAAFEHSDCLPDERGVLAVPADAPGGHGGNGHDWSVQSAGLHGRGSSTIGGKADWLESIML